MKKKTIDKHALEKEYWDAGLSLRELAEKVSIAQKTLLKIMRKYRIKRRTLTESWVIRRQRDLPLKQANRLFNSGVSVKEIARKLEKSDKTIRRYLNRSFLRGVRPGFKRSKQNRINISKGRKRMFKANPGLRDLLRKHRLNQVLPTKDTSIERLLEDELVRREIGHYKQYAILGLCQADKAFPDQKIAVFCDGDYWHRRPDAMQRDARINKALVENNWLVLRFWETEIRQDVKKVTDQIVASIYRR